jgi:hypothetical protein
MGGEVFLEAADLVVEDLDLDLHLLGGGEGERIALERRGVDLRVGLRDPGVSAGREDKPARAEDR